MNTSITSTITLMNLKLRLKNKGLVNMVLILDNGLFSDRIAYFLTQLKKPWKMIKSEDILLESLEELSIDAIIVSNGVERKDNINTSIKVIQRYAWRVPIFSIGIGAIATAILFNAKICDSQISNFEVFSIKHDQKTIFKDNLMLTSTKWCPYTISQQLFSKSDLESSAFVNDEMVAFRHKNLSIEGCLFDITSFTCQEGNQILENFINYY
jgi:anthranilate/para-aminobenzoate synthase component II